MLALEKLDSGWLEFLEATRSGNSPKTEFQSKVATIPKYWIIVFSSSIFMPDSRPRYNILNPLFGLSQKKKKKKRKRKRKWTYFDQLPIDIIPWYIITIDNDNLFFFCFFFSFLNHFLVAVDHLRLKN